MNTLTGDVDLYFSLSYANYVAYPRTLLQSMPEEWQQRFYDLMTEYDDHWRGLPKGFFPGEYRVQPTRDGKLVAWSEFRAPHYNRTRTRVTPDGAVTGEGWR